MNATSGRPSPPSMAEFDSYADGYDAGMDNPLKRILGNDPAAYLRVKIDWMLRDLRSRSVASVVADRPCFLDYGCGNGLFLKVLSDQGFVGELSGCDVSREMLTRAARTWENRDPPRFFLLQDDDPQPAAAPYDIVVLCAVLHHIAPTQRLATYQKVHGLLKPEGRVYVFEHNPLNPVTSWVVRRTPIDRNAILLRAREVIHGLDQVGFRGLGTSYQMFFPPRMRSLNWVESFLRWLPLGGQYAVWGEKS
jgi:SAM-dependent methyltransferase